MVTLNPTSEHSRQDGDLFVLDLLSDKGMKNSWAWFWLVAFWETREFLGLMGEKGSKQKCPQHPQVGTLLIKTCFLKHKLLGHI